MLAAAADQTTLLAAGLTDPPPRPPSTSRVDAWRKTAARYESDPSTGEGLKELRARAKEQEEERDLALAKYHHYEIASAAFQVGIVLASATLITGIFSLAWFSGALGAIGLLLLCLGLFAPNLVYVLVVAPHTAGGGRPACMQAARSVFTSRHTIVIGPTPPGTGVMAPATLTASE